MTDEPGDRFSVALPHEDYRCGRVALVGRSNVGKSTLFNALMDFHLSIVSPRPQTTRHHILGIASQPGGQIIYVDAPGWHRGARRAMNRRLNRIALTATREADLVLQVIEAGSWKEEDEALYTTLNLDQGLSRLLVINKIDRCKNKTALLPQVAKLSASHPFEAIYYVSALKGHGIKLLQRELATWLPVRPPVFAEDEITDRSERFLAAEMVREQLMFRLAQELPYFTAVEIEYFRDRPDGVSEIHATIWVERDRQKAIVIGHQGKQLKLIGSVARWHMERMFTRKVLLRLWVKVRTGWTDNESMLRQSGHTD